MKMERYFTKIMSKKMMMVRCNKCKQIMSLGYFITKHTCLPAEAVILTPEEIQKYTNKKKKTAKD